MAPTKKTRFQIWAFQLKSKKPDTLPAPDRAHRVRRLDENPKDWPKNSNENIMAEIMIPDVYHDQGWEMNSIT